MNNYFKECRNEIQLRTEQMVERKAYETEIDSLERRLRTLESNYDRLKITYKSNLERLALMKVDLGVAKESYEFAKTMLDKKRELVVEGKKKLDDSHLKMWEEERNACDELYKRIAENDSISFLNEYPTVLRTKKYEFDHQHESDEIVKKAVAEHREVKQLTAEITALEIKINVNKNSCLTNDLQKVLIELKELDYDDVYKVDKTQRLIETLEQSHCERIALEDEIRAIENCKPEAICGSGSFKISQKDAKDVVDVKKETQQYKYSVIEPFYEEKLINNSFNAACENDDESLVVDKEQEKKLKAKKWYAAYAREIAVVDDEAHFDNFHSLINQSCASNTSKQTSSAVVKIPKKDDRLFSLQTVASTNLSRPDYHKYGENRVELLQKSTKNRRSPNHSKVPKSLHCSQPTISRFFQNKIKNSGTESGFPPEVKKKIAEIEEEDFDVNTVFHGTPKANRKFEPLMATPSTFVKHTVVDDNSVQAIHQTERPATSSQGIRKVTRTTKFVLKRPSKLGQTFGYRQKKLDNFLKFMLPDN